MVAYDFSSCETMVEHIAPFDGIVATDTVLVSGSMSSKSSECDVAKALLPGSGESTRDVVEYGVKYTTSGSGGSVIMDVGMGTPHVSGTWPPLEDGAEAPFDG